ncbi:MAG TPA: hypothetical protein VMP01_19255 [Pirellulaceae bacterium]|nr:hypothetical protein [Pirellulaceae bacterium]
MRRTLALVIAVLLAAAPAAAFAQAEPDQAAALRAQLEAIQKQLVDLSRKEAADHKFTEIGSSTSRTRTGEDAPRVVRIYDLSDLYAIAPPYPAQEPADLVDATRSIFPEVKVEASAGAGLGGGGFGGGGGVFAVPSTISRGKSRSTTLHQVSGGSGAASNESVRTSVDNLIDTITTTIEPDQWDDVGGPSTITALGASLVVAAPTETHAQITALLDLFRKQWGSLRTVSVEAHWLWLTEEQIAAAIAEGKGLNPPAPFGALSPAAWQALQAQARAAGQARRNYHAILTCYNGQTVSALAGVQRLFVSGLTPIVGGGESESAAYNPQVKAVQDGAALQITPVVTRTAKYVVADVHSRVNLLGDAPPAAAAKDAGPVAQVVAALDRPALESQRLSTTLRIPVDTPTLIGGMTFAGDGESKANLYLFLTASVRELKDEEKAEVNEAEKPAK